MSDDRKFKLHNGQHGAAITVRVTPRSSRNEIAEVLNDGTIKIRLTAAPVEGAANKALISFLAEVLDTAQSNIDIIGGLTSRDKLVTIRDLTPDQVQERIVARLA
ncbi:MAG TPA: DUF167 domain-containing protein [Anaerolineaceae bacterium]|jgi:uncharacterized protein (TIGR00251 family)|nr:DUF167 domain-containing protein [Anaerolineaceae bacterium]HQF62947.1 DUF167 domain-containing protein [Anaerolineaceae bacterium]HQH85958.1 DUF167 domain-containing protein [Anaerolineaceae bacterium]HQN43994.1 DUF167 domain-containing protein [Anaerolineaceae bacterium]